mgnify:CR=1 FL=1
MPVNGWVGPGERSQFTPSTGSPEIRTPNILLIEPMLYLGMEMNKDSIARGWRQTVRSSMTNHRTFPPSPSSKEFPVQRHLSAGGHLVATSALHDAFYAFYASYAGLHNPFSHL